MTGLDTEPNIPIAIHPNIQLATMNITKRELALTVADKTGLPYKDALAASQAFMDAVVEELAAGNRLEFRDFGIWEVRERKARLAHNPKRPDEKVNVPPKKAVKFKPGRLMKAAMQNEPSKKI